MCGEPGLDGRQGRVLDAARRAAARGVDCRSGWGALVRPDRPVGRDRVRRGHVDPDLRVQRRLPRPDPAGRTRRDGRRPHPQRAGGRDHRALARHAPAARDGRRSPSADRAGCHLGSELDDRPAGGDPLVPPASARRDGGAGRLGSRRALPRRRSGRAGSAPAARVRRRRRADRRAGRAVRLRRRVRQNQQLRRLARRPIARQRHDRAIPRRRDRRHPAPSGQRLDRSRLRFRLLRRPRVRPDRQRRRPSRGASHHDRRAALAGRAGRDPGHDDPGGDRGTALRAARPRRHHRILRRQRWRR